MVNEKRKEGLSSQDEVRAEGGRVISKERELNSSSGKVIGK